MVTALSVRQIFLAGHMPAVAFYTLAAIEAVGITVSLAKVTGMLDSFRVGNDLGKNIWQSYLDTLGVLAVAVLVQVRGSATVGLCRAHEHAS